MPSRILPTSLVRPPIKSMARTLALAVMLALSLSTAHAINLDQAKNQGMVCELPTGYLKATANATPEVSKMVNDINARRRAEYKRIAEQHGVTSEQVGKLTAQKLKPKCQ